MAMQGVDDFEAWTRRYWNAWGETLRSTQHVDAPPMPGWNDAMNWWSHLARGGVPQGDEAVSRFNAQAQGWFGQMQQLAAQFAGRPASAADIAAAWKQALGGDAANPFAQMLGMMPGQANLDASQWIESFAPLMQAWQRDGRSWLGLPAFGFAREHQERWQHLAQAQVDVQEQSQAYQTLLAEAAQDAFVRFERKLEQRSAPGRQVDSVRGLFDLWIDAAEESYADIALSPRFRDAYAAMVNAQMTLRGRLQKEVEQMCVQCGMPTRTEVDSAHRKIVELERELRRLRDRMDMPAHSAAARAEPAAPSPARAATPRRAAAPATKRAAAVHKPAKATKATKPTKATKATKPATKKAGKR
ncbi:class III poly(R)-hydroxyalkanoic acid synthase subunit PhaE [Lysobacter sp. LF1]|uniref:Poly(3-hydroxyalkanoate) polymerase subunit PhaE n=1 Tax=Lysobacter stagni TaxID=3045172 RepID=A0ABT6XHF5_9GAMM|nr:class III poly(R)-hydroxyalkanoic acid synthase subunit PhaE [Lysobacter sp. LF1]MDI9239589.1 class III poly(R)-hydroxyalkanoic acid synthase subunit PhaE [Lysobacter sp. LF1]